MSSSPPPPSPLASPEPWNLVAAAYTAELLGEFAFYSAKALDLAGVAAGQRVLDVATGPGTLAVLAAGRGASVDALDFSASMLAELERRLREGAITGVTAHQGDGQALPFADAQYDAAFSMFGLMFFPDRVQGLRELARVLKPGCPAVIASWAPFEGAFSMVLDSLRAELPGLPFGQGKGPLSEPGDIRDEMGQAGFEGVQVEVVPHASPVRTLDEFWGSVQRTTAPVVLLRRKLAEERWKEVAAGVEARLRVLLGDGPFDISFRALLGRGVSPVRG